MLFEDEVVRQAEIELVHVALDHFHCYWLQITHLTCTHLRLCLPYHVWKSLQVPSSSHLMSHLGMGFLRCTFATSPEYAIIVQELSFSS